MALKSITAILVASLFGVFCRAQSATTGPTTAQPNDLGIIVAPDTTVFTEPLQSNGSVDYIAAVNAQESRGITSTNNAACLLIRITRAELKPSYIQQRAETLRLLGVEDKPEDNIAWQFWRGFKHPMPTDNPENPGYVDRFELAKGQPWSAQEIPELAEWLKSNERAFTIAEEASKRNRFWLPNVLLPGDSGLISVQHPGLDILANIRAGLCIRSMLRLQQGDTSGALQDLLTAQRLGHLLCQSAEPTTLVFGTTFQEAACRSAWWLLQTPGIPTDQLRRSSIDLIAVGSIPNPPRQLWRLARYRFLDSVQILAAAQNKELLKHMKANELPKFQGALADAKIPLLDWNRVLRFGNSFYDALEKDDSLLPADQRAADKKAFNERYAQLEKTAEAADVGAGGNPPKWILPQAGETRDVYSDRVGAVILMMQMPSFGRISEIIRRCNARVDWTARAGVALAIYRNEHGEYPATLDALIPKYLPHLPENTSSNPVAYERRDVGYVIRNVTTYSPIRAKLLAERHQDYDWDDIIIRTDRPPS
jgi:hypothetical protein